MVSLRSAALAIVVSSGALLGAPAEAQSTAALKVTARVIDECTIIAKDRRELAQLARDLNDPGVISHCSKGVVSRVDQRVVAIGSLQPPASLPVRRSLGIERIASPNPDRKRDVVLVTVSY